MVSFSNKIKFMLYCPKCKRTYPEGGQRFCTNDGGRLHPMPSPEKSAAASQAVFTSLLNRGEQKGNSDEKLAESPKFIRPTPPAVSDRPIRVPLPPAEEMPSLPLKKTPIRLIRPHEIPSSQAELGDREKYPTGRLAISWANPNVMLGQTVKGRYYIEEKLSQDESSITFLASDKILMGRKVSVKILMDEAAGSSFESGSLADERVSLSHINHPNIAHLFDSGSLLEGKPFLVREYVDGKTLGTMIRQGGQVNSLRAGRIARQIAQGLSHAHQNGVVHRNLAPEKIVLGVSGAGSEQVKIVDFGEVEGKRKFDADKWAYLAPEQLEGGEASSASDIYSLGVIAYEMLTGRLPFQFSSSRELLDAQRRGLKIKPTNIRIDLGDGVDEAIKKALAFAPSERYARASEFGEALFAALSDRGPAIPKPAEEPLPGNPLDMGLSKDTAKVSGELISLKKEVGSPLVNILEPAEGSNEEELVAMQPGNEDLPWEKRSPEPIRALSLGWLLGGLLGIALVAAGAFFIWQYYLHRPEKIENPVVQALPEAKSDVPIIRDATPSPEVAGEDKIEVPPQQRIIQKPENTTYFQNTKENQPDNLLKNFRGFSLYYPSGWAKREKFGDNFVEVSKLNESGGTEESMIIGYYPSKGTFKDDLPAFPELLKKADKELTKDLKNYRRLSEGEIYINNDRKAYEMKFQGNRPDAQGKDVTFWGRLLFVPVQRRGTKSGLRVTMIATSFSELIKSIDDVGTKGDLGQILETFEPEDPLIP